MLVNNVQEYDPRKGKVHKASDEELVETLNANTFPAVFMSRFLGPELKARSGDTTKSAIINSMSYYADAPVKTLPILSASASA